jgi:hypothetical protein
LVIGSYFTNEKDEEMRPGRTGGVAQVAEHLLASMRPSIQALELSKKKKKR